MSALPRSATAILFAGLASAALGACGSGGGAASSSASTDSWTSTTPAAPGSTHPAEHLGNFKPEKAERDQSPPDPNLSAERARAGRAADFVAPGADNSVPTYGSEAAIAERRDAEASLRAFLRARAAGNWAAACAQLSAAAIRGYQRLADESLRGHACEALLRAHTSDASDPLTGALTALRVHGLNGFALFVGSPHHQPYIVPMHRERGRWKLTQSGPIAYPPGSAR